MSDNALVPLVATPAQLVSDMGTVFTSLDLSTEEGKRQFLRSIGESDFAAEDVKKGSFEVQDFLCHRVNLEKDGGEIVEASRTVLIAPDGSTVSFVSIGVKASLAALIVVYGVPPWKPARKLELKETNSRKGRRVYRLLPV